MARQTKKQKDAQQAVQDRLTSDVPLRVDAEAKTGGSSVNRVTEIHPSLESLTQSLSDQGLQSSMVTTNSGLRVQVSRSKRGGGYRPQAPEFGNEKAPATTEVGENAQMLETPIGYEHGPEAAKKFVHEANALRNTPDPLASNDVVQGVKALVGAPSVGGNYLSPGARTRIANLDAVRLPQSTAAMRPATAQGENPLSAGRAARRAGTSVSPVFESAHEMVAHGLGYTPAVQEQMLQVARRRVGGRNIPTPAPGAHRRQGTRPPGAPTGLTSAEMEARAQGMVQEHIDTAIRGTRDTSPDMYDENVAEATRLGAVGGIMNTGNTGDLAPRGRSAGARELGNTPSRTPENRQARKVAAAVEPVATKSPELRRTLDEAVARDQSIIKKEAQARRRKAVPGEERSTLSVGTDIEQRERRHAQFVFSTGGAMAMATELEAQGQTEAAGRARQVGLSRLRVGRAPEPKKTPLPPAARAPLSDSGTTPPPAQSNIANPSPPRTANTPKVVPENPPTAAARTAPARRGGGSTESALANARAEVAKRARK